MDKAKRKEGRFMEREVLMAEFSDILHAGYQAVLMGDCI